MNLKNIKKVGFIENFNPTKGYPEFAIAVKPKAAPVVKVKKFKLGNPELIAAKKAWRRSVDSSYKPTVLVKYC